MTRVSALVGGLAIAALAVGAGLGGARASARADTVDISVPATVSFFVTDVSSPTRGNPSPTPVIFSNASLKKDRGVRLSIRADGNFTGPGGSTIPASHVSWAIASATGGFGFAGTLGTTSFTELFQAFADTPAGGVELAWSLAPISGPVRAGTHTLSVRWRIESVKP